MIINSGSGTREWMSAARALERLSEARTRRRNNLEGSLAVLVLLALFNASALYQATFAGRLFVLGFLLIIPGTVVLSLTTARPREASVRVAWALGISMLVVMLVGLVESLVLPHFGVAKPLRARPLLIGVDLVVVSVLLIGRRRDPMDFLFHDARPTSGDVLLAVLLALLPLGAVGGAERLDNLGQGSLSVAVLIAGAVVLAGLLLGGERLRQRTVTLSLFSVSASFVLLSSMRSTHPYGFDIQTEFQVFTSTLHRGAWQVPSNGNAYASMLSITVLPAALSALSGTSPVYLFKFLYPFVFAVLPVLTYIAAQRVFPRRAALVGPVILIGQGLFAADIGGLARQEVGLLYFGLLVVSALDPSLERHWRQAGVTVAMAAMAVTHYSTAYFATIVLVGGYVLTLVMRALGGQGGRRGSLSMSVVAVSVAAVLLWNVVITHSAGDLANVAAALGTSGLALLPGTGGESFIQRFLNSTVATQVSLKSFVTLTTHYYHTTAPYLHPYPATVTSHYPVQGVTVPGSAAGSGLVPSVVYYGATVWAELFLVVTVIGIFGFTWRGRQGRPGRDVAALALSCLVLVGLLRVSKTLSTLYGAARALVDAAPLFSIGIALVCSWLFSRRRPVGRLLLGATSAGLLLLLFVNSGLSDLTFGGRPDLFTNGGEAYQRYYFTDADIASAGWVVRHQRPGQIVYADIYGGLQMWEFAHINGLVTTVIPSVIEPGAYVYGSSTNVVDGSTRSAIGTEYATYRFPAAFLRDVKDLVFTTGTTEVFL
jgi:uncharacterized membrane protein